jgi:hypothetical protein
MNKKTASTKPTVWDIDGGTPEDTAPAVEHTTVVTEAVAPAAATKAKSKLTAPEFDLDGLMTDFPTATELQRFVFDRTGVVLDLKGRANKLKYQVAMDVLNGSIPDSEFLGSENPYVDKAEMIPTDTLKELPAKDPEIVAAGDEVLRFHTGLFPHPDPEFKSQDQNCSVQFKKYGNGMITYEILGPIAQRAVGERINKYGKMVPERYTWVDPRQGEQIVKRANGSYTALGTKLRSFMRKQRMNNSNQWDAWIDRDFVIRDELINDNPWQV